MARAVSKKKKAKSSNRKITVLLLMVPAALIVLPSTILFAIGMLPTIVAYVIDRTEEKTAPITVGGLNICGCMPFAIELWRNEHTIAAAGKIFASPLSWLIIYGAAAVGWALYYGIPPFVANLEIMRAESRVDALKQTKVGLVQEWGPEVAGDIFEEAGEAESEDAVPVIADASAE